MMKAEAELSAINELLQDGESDIESKKANSLGIQEICSTEKVAKCVSMHDYNDVKETFQSTYVKIDKKDTDDIIQQTSYTVNKVVNPEKNDSGLHTLNPNVQEFIPMIKVDTEINNNVTPAKVYTPVVSNQHPRQIKSIDQQSVN